MSDLQKRSEVGWEKKEHTLFLQDVIYIKIKTHNAYLQNTLLEVQIMFTPGVAAAMRKKEGLNAELKMFCFAIW